jgi:hypothetical protein
MFRCQLTGQVSDPVVYGKKIVVDEETNESREIYGIVKGAEKPVKLVIETRPRKYVNHYRDEDGNVETVVTHGTEIVREITIRECNLELAKRKFRL